MYLLSFSKIPRDELDGEDCKAKVFHSRDMSLFQSCRELIELFNEVVRKVYLA